MNNKILLNKKENMRKFEKELKNVININSKENSSDTPDFILAKFLIQCIENFETILSDMDNFNFKEEDTAKTIFDESIKSAIKKYYIGKIPTNILINFIVNNLKNLNQTIKSRDKFYNIINTSSQSTIILD